MGVGAGEWMMPIRVQPPTSPRLQNKENKEAGGTDTSAPPAPPRPRPLNVHLN